MKDLAKKYLPYMATILAIYLIVPLIFTAEALKVFAPVIYYFIFPATAIVCACVYCSKFGLDFLFSLIAPLVFIPSMLIYNGGFSFTNIVLLATYLVSGIFGLFIGDIAFGDKRKKREESEKVEAEEMLLEAKRRDEEFNKTVAQDSENEFKLNDIEEFDYDKYSSEMDKTPVKSDEDEIDEILKGLNHNN